MRGMGVTARRRKNLPGRSNAANPGAIGVFHDGHDEPKDSPATVAAVQGIILALTKQGYRLVTVLPLRAWDQHARTHVFFRHTFPGSPPTREHRL